MRVLLCQAVGEGSAGGVAYAREACGLIGLMVAPRKFMDPAALTDPKWEPNRLLPSPPFSLRESFSPCQRIHTKPTDPCVGSPSTCVFITQVSSFNLLMMSSSLLLSLIHI